MSRNTAAELTQRLYDRIPAHYRVYDAEQGRPLRALMAVVGEQAANLRQDLDALWDNFFIETCDDWAVPYIAALVGANLLARPVGQSNRLDVRNTVMWRRSKGTPAMLRALAGAISGWPADVAEFFEVLGWSQNVNHVRLDAPLTPDLRDPARLALLGRAADPFAHAADFKPSRALDQPRVTPGALGIGRFGWGTPGRYQIKNLGVFVRRLQTFALRGVAPAAAAPGTPPPATPPACFTFDPLFQETPLFVAATGEPLTRAQFGRAPWETFGTDVGVRRFGVLLASAAAPLPDPTGGGTVLSPRAWRFPGGVRTADRPSSAVPFTFGGAGAGLALDANAGLRVLEPRAFQLGAAHFVITARWEEVGGPVSLGALSTLLAVAGDPAAFQAGVVAGGAGRLALTVETGRAGPGWPVIPPSPPGRFPGAVLAVRAARAGALRAAEALYVYLPPALIAPSDTLTYHVADDGSSFTTAALDPAALARAAEGQVYPARSLTASTEPAAEFTVLHRGPGGLRLPDPDRFGAAPGRAAALVEASLFTGAFQPLGAVATVDQAGADHPLLDAPAVWPALTYVPSLRAVSDDLPDEGLLSILLRPLAGNTFIPQAELVAVNRLGQSLLIYLPELDGAPPQGVRLLVADDGSTYFAPPDNAAMLQVQAQGSYSGLPLARAAAGQVLPLAGVWPVQQRRPVAINLCRCERRALLHPGELGIDPELGRFAFAPGDLAADAGELSVEYVEAFGDRVGARTFERDLAAGPAPTRLVTRSGDARVSLSAPFPSDHVHPTITGAVAAAEDGDVIEIVDSATYVEAAPLIFDRPMVKSLIVRAAEGQRPCIVFSALPASPPVSPPSSPPALPPGGAAGLRIVSPLDRLTLSGLLISGGPLRIENEIKQLLVSACTLDPRTAGPDGSFVAADAAPGHFARYLLCRCIMGGVRVGAGVSRLTIADSIVDQRSGLAIGGIPALPASPPADPAAGDVQLERVTVLGRVHCEVLTASECLLDDLVLVEDRQAGCIRFSRFERGSALPRRFQCVPSDEQAGACRPDLRCLAPLFNSRRFGRPDYLQLAAACPPAILTVSEEGAEAGAFAGARTTIRMENMAIKLREFLPVGLAAVVTAET